MANQRKKTLENEGYSVWENVAVSSPECVSVNFDSKDFVGGITYWKPDLFEFHFIDTQTEKDILLETANLASVDELNSYVAKMLAEKLPLPKKSRQ